MGKPKKANKLPKPHTPRMNKKQVIDNLMQAKPKGVKEIKQNIEAQTVLNLASTLPLCIIKLREPLEAGTPGWKLLNERYAEVFDSTVIQRIQFLSPIFNIVELMLSNQKGVDYGEVVNAAVKQQVLEYMIAFVFKTYSMRMFSAMAKSNIQHVTSNILYPELQKVITDLNKGKKNESGNNRKP